MRSLSLFVALTVLFSMVSLVAMESGGLRVINDALQSIIGPIEKISNESNVAYFARTQDGYVHASKCLAGKSQGIICCAKVTTVPQESARLLPDNTFNYIATRYESQPRKSIFYSLLNRKK